MMKISTILTKARDLLEKKKWCKYEFALDEEGNRVSPKSKKACEFCAVGAIMRFTNSTKIFDYLADQTGIEGLGARTKVINYNDNYADYKERILRLFDRAIRVAKAQKK
jgi:hypothetical protein